MRSPAKSHQVQSQRNAHASCDHEAWTRTRVASASAAAQHACDASMEPSTAPPEPCGPAYQSAVLSVLSSLFPLHTCTRQGQRCFATVCKWYEHWYQLQHFSKRYCVHYQVLAVGRTQYRARYNLRNLCTRYQLRYHTHTTSPQLVLMTVPAAQLTCMVLIAIPPTSHLAGAGTACDTVHQTLAGGTGADAPWCTLSARGINSHLAVPAACNPTAAGTGHGTMYSS